jgi:hypothetical protein
LHTSCTAECTALSGMSTSQSQKVHAQERSNGCSLPARSFAVLHVSPPSTLTSTRTIPRPPPLYA